MLQWENSCPVSCSRASGPAIRQAKRAATTTTTTTKIGERVEEKKSQREREKQNKEKNDCTLFTINGDRKDGCVCVCFVWKISEGGDEITMRGGGTSIDGAAMNLSLSGAASLLTSTTVEPSDAQRTGLCRPLRSSHGLFHPLALLLDPVEAVAHVDEIGREDADPTR